MQRDARVLKWNTIDRHTGAIVGAYATLRGAESHGHAVKARTETCPKIRCNAKVAKGKRLYKAQ